jgi:hypothetical protein
MNEARFKLYIQGLKDYANQAAFKFFKDPKDQKAYNLGRFIK